MSPLVATLLVAAGGAVGSVSRYWVGVMVNAAFGSFPLATLLVNVTGSLLIGSLTATLSGDPALRTLLIAGLLGGYTTFSTFSLDVVRLVDDGRPGLAAVYVALSVGLSLSAAAAGFALSRNAS